MGWTQSGVLGWRNTGAWAGTTAVNAYQLYQLPTGGLGYVTAGRTTRSSFDATERDAWTFLPGGHYERLTSSGSWKCPVGIVQAKFRRVGGGGGGGGAGSALTSGGVATQTGGGGGGAGADTSVTVPVTPGTSYTATVGAGGTGGNGGAANGNTGVKGNNGGDTSIVIDGITYSALGGSGGAPSAANSTTSSTGGMPGVGIFTTTATAWLPGNGGAGSSTTGNGAIPMGDVVGGAAGSPANSTNGGIGGKARISPGYFPVSNNAKLGSANGGAGVSATELGCAGGGGGGGAPGGAGGAGGDGAAGYIDVWF